MHFLYLNKITGYSKKKHCPYPNTSLTIPRGSWLVELGETGRAAPESFCISSGSTSSTQTALSLSGSTQRQSERQEQGHEMVL